MSKQIQWRHPNPFVENWQITADLIDGYNHVNNVEYIRKIESTAWAHTRSLGLTLDDYKALNSGMVIQSHNVKYHKPVHLNDVIACATWVAKCDNKVKLTRRFQYVCLTHYHTVFEAETQYVCIDLTTGSPKRMPQKFIETYAKANLNLT